MIFLQLTNIPPTTSVVYVWVYVKVRHRPCGKPATEEMFLETTSLAGLEISK